MRSFLKLGKRGCNNESKMTKPAFLPLSLPLCPFPPPCLPLPFLLPFFLFVNAEQYHVLMKGNLEHTKIKLHS